MVKTCAAHVASTGRTWTGQLGIASEQHLPGLTRLADGLRGTATRSIVPLHHGGRRADPALAGHLIAPFDDPNTGAVKMTVDDVQHMVADYVAAAVRVEQAGFDGSRSTARTGSCWRSSRTSATNGLTGTAALWTTGCTRTVCFACVRSAIGTEPCGC